MRLNSKRVGMSLEVTRLPDDRSLTELDQDLWELTMT